MPSKGFVSAKGLSFYDYSFPPDAADRLFNGENPVRVWRKHRGLSVSNLAAACEFTPAAVSQIETGQRSPSIEKLKLIAAALNVEVDDII